MTSSNGNIFRVTGPSCGAFTGHRWIPLTKASYVELCCFLWPAPWINGWVNKREVGDLRRNRAHYDAIVMNDPDHDHHLTMITMMIIIMIIIHHYGHHNHHDHQRHIIIIIILITIIIFTINAMLSLWLSPTFFVYCYFYMKQPADIKCMASLLLNCFKNWLLSFSKLYYHWTYFGYVFFVQLRPMHGMYA